MRRIEETEIHSQIELMELIQEIGFLPLLNSGISGFSAEELVDDDCRYVVFPDGGWDWPLWKWKGPVVTEGNCVYGKFFNKKAGFISKEWWGDFCQYRRSVNPVPEEGSVEEAILMTLRERGSMITRELRAACGFTGPKMRSKFDGYISRLQMGCYIVTEDFVYPRDKHNREYGWGWSLLTTPEQLYGKETCQSDGAPHDSYERILTHLCQLLPEVSERKIQALIR